MGNPFDPIAAPVTVIHQVNSGWNSSRNTDGDSYRHPSCMGRIETAPVALSIELPPLSASST